MGKRSNFERRDRDFYPTPPEAVYPLIPHLVTGTDFVEPCAGDGALATTLDHLGMMCTGMWDIEPRAPGIKRENALTYVPACHPDYVITNPPWRRDILHPLIDHLSKIAPTWLLFDADWMHTRQAAPYLLKCQMIVSVGRVKWIPGSKYTGKDNCAWYLFDDTTDELKTTFHGRVNDNIH